MAAGDFGARTASRDDLDRMLEWAAEEGWNPGHDHAHAFHAGEGQPLFPDVPEPNAAALRPAQRYGLAPVSETARMYTRAPPDVDLMPVFGVTAFELG